MNNKSYTSSLQCPVYKYVQWSIYRWIHLQKRKQLNTAGWSDVMQICSGRHLFFNKLDSPERDTFL
ncbi:hypothetical protein T09_12226 [Trichinella sp. T9]|nr:hypothetical protein T09_12226 [Trichinella sp. T9]